MESKKNAWDDKNYFDSSKKGKPKMDMTGVVKRNCEIEKIGLYYIGHYSHVSMRVIVKTADGGCCFDIPYARKPLEEFFKLFDIDTENGLFAETLAGHKFCGWFTANGNGRIVGISSFFDEEGKNIIELGE